MSGTCMHNVPAVLKAALPTTSIAAYRVTLMWQSSCWREELGATSTRLTETGSITSVSRASMLR